MHSNPTYYFNYDTIFQREENKKITHNKYFLHHMQYRCMFSFSGTYNVMINPEKHHTKINFRLNVRVWTECPWLNSLSFLSKVIPCSLRVPRGVPHVNLCISAYFDTFYRLPCFYLKFSSKLPFHKNIL